MEEQYCHIISIPRIIDKNTSLASEKRAIVSNLVHFCHCKTNRAIRKYIITINTTLNDHGLNYIQPCHYSESTDIYGAVLFELKVL